MNTRIDEKYWMRLAMDIAKASTCRAEVGCILVFNKTVVGMGYVGSAHGDDHCFGEKGEPAATTKHLLVKTPVRGSTVNGDTCIRTIHAEINAILKCPWRGSKELGWIECYSTYEPCLDCTKVLIQIGVRKIFYLHNYKDEWREIYLQNVVVTPALVVLQLRM